MTERAHFQVDLRPLVDLLGRHLYSSPRVYLRELLQNGVDAITERRRRDATAPARIDIEIHDGGLTVRDTGIGLTRAQVADLLATIGRSSKRDEIGFARDEFLGQFGIGLLSAFMVADEVRFLTWPGHGDATLWIGRADGTYSVEDAPPPSEIGSLVTLEAAADSGPWLQAGSVLELARLFGSMLPVAITVDGERIDEQPPWDATLPPNERRAALVGYAQDQLGFTPLDVIEVRGLSAGLEGAAFVLPFAANPTERGAHRVYLKRMLLGENVTNLLPDWAFFARCIIETSGLQPTANREALYEDDLLASTRLELAEQIRGWLTQLARTDPIKLAAFLQIHERGVMALALHDDEMLRLVAQQVLFETNHGPMTLAEFRDRSGVVTYTTTTAEFRQLAVVAAAQEIPLVNGGYTMGCDLIEALPRLEDGYQIRTFGAQGLVGSFEFPTSGTADQSSAFLSRAGRILADTGCDVLLRAFDPASVASVYLVDRSAARAEALRVTRDRADGLWAGILDSLAPMETARPRLVLNHRSPLIRRLVGISDERVLTLSLQGLYGYALILGQHEITPDDAAIVSSSFLGLVDRATSRHSGASDTR